MCLSFGFYGDQGVSCGGGEKHQQYRIDPEWEQEDGTPPGAEHGPCGAAAHSPSQTPLTAGCEESLSPPTEPWNTDEQTSWAGEGRNERRPAGGAVPVMAQRSHVHVHSGGVRSRGALQPIRESVSFTPHRPGCSEMASRWILVCLYLYASILRLNHLVSFQSQHLYEIKTWRLNSTKTMLLK